jgi:hypothetical protein
MGMGWEEPLLKGALVKRANCRSHSGEEYAAVDIMIPWNIVRRLPREEGWNLMDYGYFTLICCVNAPHGCKYTPCQVLEIISPTSDPQSPKTHVVPTLLGAV